jgi:hypothetical protein
MSELLREKGDIAGFFGVFSVIFRNDLYLTYYYSNI